MAARSGLMNSARSAPAAGNLSEAGCPRSLPDIRGGGMPPSRDSRPLWSRPRGPPRSWLSRADSGVHRGGGSGRLRSRSRSDGRMKSLGFGSGPRRSPGYSRGGRSPGRSRRPSSGRRESRPSRRSLCRKEGCLSNGPRLGNGASGLLGRL